MSLSTKSTKLYTPLNNMTFYGPSKLLSLGAKVRACQNNKVARSHFQVESYSGMLRRIRIDTNVVFFSLRGKTLQGRN